MSSPAVYTGLWKNYNTADPEARAIRGLTLTVKQEVGTVLISFLTVFVGFALAHIWNITRFFIHQFRSTSALRPGIYHQQQALFRNTPSVKWTIWGLIQLAWTWKGRTPGAVRGSITMILATTLFFVLSLFASIRFSSLVVLPGHEVLLAGDKCGYINATSNAILPMEDDDRQIILAAQKTIARSLADQAAQYVRACYDPLRDPKSGECREFPGTMAGVTMSIVPCPFDPDVCGQSEAVRLDSGILDSNDHLGVNTAPEDRVGSRTVLTCVPLDIDDYSTPWVNFEGLLPTDDDWPLFKAHDFGPIAYGYNWTFVTSSANAWQPDPGYGWAGNAYNLQVISGRERDRELPQNTSGNAINWFPIPKLRVNNSDTHLLVLKSEARYSFPVEDPWFRATNTSGGEDAPWRIEVSQPTAIANGTAKYFIPDQPSSVLGCIIQGEICSGGRCTGLKSPSTSSIDKAADFLGMNDRQRAINSMWYTSGNLNRGFGGYFTYASKLLRATDSLQYGDMSGRLSVYSHPLPPRQWITEVSNIFNTTVAVVQHYGRVLASPPDLPVQRQMVEGAAAAAKAANNQSRTVDFASLPPGLIRDTGICTMVRAWDARYINFDFVPFVLCLVFGVLVFLLDVLGLHGLFFWMQDRLGMSRYRRYEWVENGLFRLQRLVFEAQGSGPWVVESDYAIPWLPLAGSGDGEDGRPAKTARDDGRAMNLMSPSSVGDDTALMAGIPLRDNRSQSPWGFESSQQFQQHAPWSPISPQEGDHGMMYMRRQPVRKETDTSTLVGGSPDPYSRRMFDERR